MQRVTAILMAFLFDDAGQRDSLATLRALTAGPIQVAHAIPGRVRFIIPSLRQSGLDEPMIERLRSLHGIRRVEVNPISGSLLVLYGQDQIDPPLLLGAVARLLGLDDALESTPTPAMTRELRLLAESVNRAVFAKTHGLLDLWSIMALMLLVVGGRKIMADGARSLPAGLTLVWWAIHSLRARGDAPQ